VLVDQFIVDQEINNTVSRRRLKLISKESARKTALDLGSKMVLPDA